MRRRRARHKRPHPLLTRRTATGIVLARRVEVGENPRGRATVIGPNRAASQTPLRVDRLNRGRDIPMEALE
jgi:hypothetical protein